MKRAKWKGPFIKIRKFKKNIIPLFDRNLEVTMRIVGLTCKVYSGKKLVKLIVSREMVGHKIGEFLPTRKLFF